VLPVLVDHMGWWTVDASNVLVKVTFRMYLTDFQTQSP
jgi:hypothetical protein